MIKKSHRKALAIISMIIVLLLALVFFWRMHIHARRGELPRYSLENPKQIKIDGVVLNKPRVISEFNLTADNGNSFTHENLTKHWSLVFFGFTSCGYVCPTTLSALDKMYVQLRAQLPAPLLPKVIMVSVDPDRDSVERMHEYLQSFNPDFVGVRGSLQQTQILAQQMSVVFSKVDNANSDNYMVNHSAEIMLLDPEGNLRAFFSYPHDATQMAQDYTAVIRAARA